MKHFILTVRRAEHTFGNHQSELRHMINPHAVGPQPAFSLKDILAWEPLHFEHSHFGFNLPIQRCHLAPVFPDGMLDHPKRGCLNSLPIPR